MGESIEQFAGAVTQPMAAAVAPPLPTQTVELIAADAIPAIPPPEPSQPVAVAPTGLAKPYTPKDAPDAPPVVVDQAVLAAGENAAQREALQRRARMHRSQNAVTIPGNVRAARVVSEPAPAMAAVPDPDLVALKPSRKPLVIAAVLAVMGLGVAAFYGLRPAPPKAPVATVATAPTAPAAAPIGNEPPAAAPQQEPEPATASPPINEPVAAAEPEPEPKVREPQKKATSPNRVSKPSTGAAPTPTRKTSTSKSAAGAKTKGGLPLRDAPF